MTCIAAVSDGQQVWMAADSIAVGTNGTHLDVVKIVEFDQGVLLGVAGQSRSIPLLRRRLEVGNPASVDPDEWAQKVAEVATALLLEAGVVDGNDAHEFAGTLLLAWAGHMWEIQTGVANRITRRYHAIGSGDEVALGALWALDAAGGVGFGERVEGAVRAACDHLVHCGGEVTVRST